MCVIEMKPKDLKSADPDNELLPISILDGLHNDMFHLQNMFSGSPAYWSAKAGFFTRVIKIE
jgi:hypothetical protein